MAKMYRMMFIFICLLCVSGTPAAETGHSPSWPAPPDEPRVEYLDEIACADLAMQAGLFGRIKRFVGGRSSAEKIGLPFDIIMVGRTLFMTCQNVPALVEVDPLKKTYRLHRCDSKPFKYPIALCAGDDRVFLTDSENGIVYQFAGGRIEPLITSGLFRPTGIAALESVRRLYVVDTGDHSVKIFDYEGNPIRTVGGRGAESAIDLHFPTFAAGMNNETVLVNDALNYKIKRLDSDGALLSAFGGEGDGPGTFARPKGLAVDSHGQIYVVDNLFDNIQVFDAKGQLLVVIGTSGQEAGQFWSPGGIDIANDTIYVADTFNNRIQILHYLGDGP